MLGILNTPKYQSNPILYDSYINSLARPFTTRNFTKLLSIFISEKNQILKGNIPIFIVRGNSKILKQVNTKMFVSSSLENVLNRVSSASSNDKDKQISHMLTLLEL